MRIITLALVSALSALSLSRAQAAEKTAVHGILIFASNEKAPADPRLAPYEAPLQRNLPESSFRFAGEGSATTVDGGRAAVALGSGHRLEFEREKEAGPGIRLKIQWIHGKEVAMSGTFTLQSGVPIVLGRRPSGNGEVPIVLVIAK